MQFRSTRSPASPARRAAPAARRFRHLSHYFDAVSLVHAAGYFRTYELPACSVTGLQGVFEPSQPLRRRELDDSGLWDMRRLARVSGHVLRLSRTAVAGANAVACPHPPPPPAPAPPPPLPRPCVHGGGVDMQSFTCLL
jgi:hypothetical protein